MITIVNLNCGNLLSLSQALSHLKVPHKVSCSPEDIASASAIILPGVGHFGFAVQRMDALGLRRAIIDSVKLGIPLLGICLGMQMLFDESDEATPEDFGLGLISGKVRSLRDLGVDARVPHVGWNSLVVKEEAGQMFDGVTKSEDVYFVHSYAAVPFHSSAVRATCIYAEVEIVVAVEHDNVYGVQFHPEKSSNVGRLILRNFVELTC